MLTPFVARAATGSTDLLELTPLPLALSLTPVTLELPELLMLTFQVAALPFFALVGPVTVTLLIAAYLPGDPWGPVGPTGPIGPVEPVGPAGPVGSATPDPESGTVSGEAAEL